MQGLMQDWPLTVDKILDHAADWHGDREVVTPLGRGADRAHHLRRHPRARQAALQRPAGAGRQARRPGGDPGLELRPAHRGLVRDHGHRRGLPHPEPAPVRRPALLHHQPRRGSDHLHRPDLPADPDRSTATEMPTVEHDHRHDRRGPHGRASACPARSASRPWSSSTRPTASGAASTRTPPAALCYTSGTTGNPKGVLYSHRSNFLHTLVTLQTRRHGPVGAATWCCRWCRCSTPTPGAWPSPAPAVGCQAGDAGPEDGRRLDPRAAGDRGRHLLGRRADGLADAAAAPARDRRRSSPR